jgi:hypothetical protein
MLCYREQFPKIATQIVALCNDIGNALKSENSHEFVSNERWKFAIEQLSIR